MSDPAIIVFGNEKGGTGKSTTAIQVAVGLMKAGHSVATLDLDVRQGSLSRYVENRAARGNLLVPVHVGVAASDLGYPAWAAEADRDALDDALHLFGGVDFVIVDTPGNDTQLSRLAHARADVLVTPINDSFLDLDVLARLDPQTHEFLGASVYSKMVIDLDRARARAGTRLLDWIVIRNRLGHAEARNKRQMSDALAHLATELGFRMARGFGERVIFRELFLSGLTLFDLGGAAGGPSLSMSHIAARHEARALIEAILSSPGIAEARRQGAAAAA